MANSDRISEVYYGKILDENLQQLTRERIHWIIKQATGLKVLDIGYSQGIVFILLEREGFDVTGIDIERGAIEYTSHELEQEEKEVRDRIRLINADVLDYDFGAIEFYTVIAVEVIEHLI